MQKFVTIRHTKSNTHRCSTIGARTGIVVHGHSVIHPSPRRVPLAMTTAHATSTISGALTRTLLGLTLVEACSVGQGAFGARVEPEEEAQALESRRRARAEASTSADVSPPPPLPARRNAKCVECSAAPFVLKQVENLYLRGRADPVALAPDVAFEDPAALVEGLDEVREAFRAVRAFAPSADAPAEVAQIDARRYVVRTAVRYALPLTGPDGLVVRSDVLVTLAERDGKIERLEERWNGARLLEGFPFDMVRRGVGIVLRAITPWLLPDRDGGDARARW